MFLCRSTCFKRRHAHHQELTTALKASGFTVGALMVAALLVVIVRLLEAVNAVVSL
jgi:hypothetical protein